MSKEIYFDVKEFNNIKERILTIYVRLGDKNDLC